LLLALRLLLAIASKGSIRPMDTTKQAIAGGHDERSQVVVSARWALIMGCAYLILFSPRGVSPAGLGVIAVFLASNFFLARQPIGALRSHAFQLSLAAADTVMICAALYVAGEFTIELLVLFLGVLVLAIAGLPSWTIAACTLLMGAAYLTMVWLAGGPAATWKSGTLLRAPFLLGVALSYAALVDASGARFRRAANLAHELALQLEAIRRCQAALASGAAGTVVATLREMEERGTVALAQCGAAESDFEPEVSVTPVTVPVVGS
jgi:hypothetical protein